MDKLIFISNDDGYDAEGVKQLAEIAREYGDVFVVAPDGARSGASMSISSYTPVRNRVRRMTARRWPLRSCCLADLTWFWEESIMVTTVR